MHFHFYAGFIGVVKNTAIAAKEINRNEILKMSGVNII
ncbi:hypothetical protein l13_05630 [Neisseria weaveri ATCC 51223]|nr:hypothetical protein l13_05630 [Neisseria weaveri ATCC 51223]